MHKRYVFLTSDGLTDDMKKKFFDIIRKNPKEVRVLYIPTAGIETDGARESFAIGLHELLLMGIHYDNILVYNLELLLSKGYERTYSSYIEEIPMVAKLLTAEELKAFDAVFVSGGDSAVLCREMVRTGLNNTIKKAINNGLIYVGISAGSIYAAGNLDEGLHIISNAIIPHWSGDKRIDLPSDSSDIPLTDGQAIYIESNKIILI